MIKDERHEENRQNFYSVYRLVPLMGFEPTRHF